MRRAEFVKRAITLSILVCITAFLCGSCSDIANRANKDIAANSDNYADKGLKLSAWTVYWDSENVSAEVESLRGKLSEMIYFAAYFDKNDQLFVPTETEETFNKIGNSKSRLKNKNYLAIVNDKVNGDGTKSLKSTDLLYRLFSDDGAMNRHMDDIIGIAEKGGYDGVEIDYEAIKEDNVLWNMFLSFSSRLYKRLSGAGLKMRVDLESDAPIGNFRFPEGPEYVMICYNLFGANDKPGPKADRQFILELADKMSRLHGDKSFAFATGGFDWGEKGEAGAITEQNADALMKEYSVIPDRDENSGDLTFKYTDKEGSKHEVWFADGTTLVSWINCIKSKSFYNVSIWRLGGNSKNSLKLLSEE